MFEHWDEFYLFAGGAAAVLIGLIFVVVSFMQDRPRSAVMAGARIYMGPIVLTMSLVLLLSAAALAPGITAGEMAALAGASAAYGLYRSIRSIVGIRGFRAVGEAPHWSDAWCYGTIPAALHLCLATVAVAFWQGWPGAARGLAEVIVLLLLIAIRNEWDLITWLAPRSDGPDELAPH